MINNHLIRISIFLSAIISIILTIFPQLDIDFSSLFYNGTKFIYKDYHIVKIIFYSVPTLTKAVCIIMLIAMLYKFVKEKNSKKIILSFGFYMAITAAIGPGLIVNYALKNHFGRARPNQIENFGGDKIFSRAWIPTDQCKRNCSFSSGHAAMGYYFTNLAYIAPLYFTTIYTTALFLGSLIGLSRVLMGGHFLSDIVTSCFIILTINHIAYIQWKKLCVQVKNNVKKDSSNL